MVTPVTNSRIWLFTAAECAIVSVAAALVALVFESNAPGWAQELFVVVLLVNAGVIGTSWRP